MIWGAIWIGGRSDIVIMERDLTSARNGYSAISYEQCLNQALSDDWFQELIFMQDNAPIHRADRIVSWFQERSRQLLEWPPNSPDLNPIEHVWAMLKRLINERYPDLLRQGQSAVAVEAFKEAIRECWRLLDQEKIDSLIRSMTTRVNTVIAVEGWHTRF